MFQLEITSIQEDIAYHKKELELAKARLENIEAATEYSTNALASIEDCLNHIEPSFLGILKDRIDQMFSDNSKSNQIGLEQLDPQEVKEETPQEMCSKEQEEPQPEKTEKEFGKLSYYELTGKPDNRAPSYEDLASNIVYSNSGRAYVGFDSRKEAEEFRDSISEPAMIGDTDTMNGFKFEVKFYCDRSYLEELLQGMTEEKEESIQTPNYEKIDGQLHYNHVDSIVYMAFKAKGRADNYGSYLTRILDIGEKYTVSNKPSFFDSKYELRIEGVDFDSALHLQNFNLSKEYDHSVNKEARELWRESRKRKYDSACKPNPKLTPIEDINLGDIVYLNSIDNQYKVLQKVKYAGLPSLEVVCTFNSERPSLVGLTSYLTTAYLVPAESIQVDSTLQKDTANLKPVLKEVKKSDRFTENDFPAGPYKKVGLDELEFGDIITNSPNSRSAYEVVQHNGDRVMAVCLYNLPLPKRVGEEYYFSTPFLVEKGTEEVVAA